MPLDYLDIHCEVTTDLSSQQYHYVKISADNRITIATAQGEACLGILQEPVDGSGTTTTARVRIFGKSKLRYGVTLARNLPIACESDGEGGVAAADDTVVGFTLESGVDQDIKWVVVMTASGEFQN